MIFDSLRNISLYKSLTPNLDKAIQFILNTNLDELAVGKHTIAGEDVFVLINEYEPKNESDCVIESHRKYIDIQIMLSGVEKFGFTALDNQLIVEGYNEENDYTFYKADLSYLILDEGKFAIFFPTDLHCPSIKTVNSTTVKKAVIKVRV